jgi:hypothetical protein
MKKYASPTVIFAIVLVSCGLYALYQSVMFAHGEPSLIRDAGKATLAVVAGSIALTVGVILAFLIGVDALTSRNQKDD